jgi:hypothetical protein
MSNKPVELLEGLTANQQRNLIFFNKRRSTTIPQGSTLQAIGNGSGRYPIN